ncbi:hypothetical protein HYT55_01195 [Candidatus Woesearchaeota archaeon]|nr:hypothetical protein [Candidatus Woesearchaeota archaeon]
MEYMYDLRLTIRDFLDQETILKQYSAQNLSLPNPISTGDQLTLTSSSP